MQTRRQRRIFWIFSDGESRCRDLFMVSGTLFKRTRIPHSICFLHGLEIWAVVTIVLENVIGICILCSKASMVFRNWKAPKPFVKANYAYSPSNHVSPLQRPRPPIDHRHSRGYNGRTYGSWLRRSGGSHSRARCGSSLCSYQALTRRKNIFGSRSPDEALWGTQRFPF